MQTTWILAADSSRARIFEADAGMRLKAIEEFEHPEGSAQNRELVTDAHGRYFGRGERDQGHAAEPNVSATQHENELFSRTVTEFLNKAVLQHRYDKLCVIAPPKFLGLIRQNLNKEAQKSVKEEIAKDLSKLKPHELADYLRDSRH